MNKELEKAIARYEKESVAAFRAIRRNIDANIQRIDRETAIRRRNLFLLSFMAGFALARIYFGV